MVNISVAYGSPMTSLFLPTVLKNSKKCYKNSTTLGLKSGSATKVMYNEFGEDVEQPTTSTATKSKKWIFTSTSVNTSPRKEQEIKRVMTLGRQGFGRATAIFKTKDIPIVLKGQVYDQ